jgi:glutamyl-tRNA reductase
MRRQANAAKGGNVRSREQACGDRQPADGQELELAIRAARDGAERARQEVMAKHARRLASLSERQRATVDEVTRALVERLVGDPLRRAYQYAGRTDGIPSVRLLCELFASGDSVDGTTR